MVAYRQYRSYGGESAGKGHPGEGAGTNSRGLSDRKVAQPAENPIKFKKRNDRCEPPGAAGSWAAHICRNCNAHTVAIGFSESLGHLSARLCSDAASLIAYVEGGGRRRSAGCAP